MSKIVILTGAPSITVEELEAGGIPISNALKTVGKSCASFVVPLSTLGGLAVATYLNSHGWNTEIIDYFQDELHLADAKIVGISTSLLNIQNIKEIVAAVRAQNLHCKIVLGGPLYWSYSPEQLFSAVPEIDFVVKKEGEETFLELVRTIMDGKDVGSVRGIFYKEADARLVETADREPIDMTLLPVPDWDLIIRKRKRKLFLVETARGCMYSCAFCSEVHFWGKPVRFKTATQVLNEIQHYTEKYNVTAFRFVDSCFTAPRNRCIEICNGIKERFIDNGINVVWSSFARVSDLNSELLAAMRRAGCVAIDIGMESGDEKILKNMNKNYTRQSIINAIKEAKNQGVITHCNMIVGLPGETRESIESTVEILNLTTPDTYHAMLLDVAPNTDLASNPSNYSISGWRLKWQHPSMSSDEAAKILNEIPYKISGSCLFPGGEYYSSLLVSLGYTVDQVRTFFQRLRTGTTTETERDMILQVFCPD